MKRSNFLTAVGSALLFPFSSLANAVEKESGLKQIKPFTAETVTLDIAAEIMALVAWNHLREDRFKSSISITQERQYVRKESYGTSVSSNPQPGFEEELNGVTLYSSVTCQRVRIFKDGDWACSLDLEQLDKIWKLEYETIVRNVKTGKERKETHTNSGHGLNQIKMASFYLEKGFYKLI